MPLNQSLKHLAFSALAKFDRPSSVPLNSIRNFLILQHASALGTVIHSTPLIPALRAAVPDARIVVAASGYGLDIFRHNPGVTTVVPTLSPTKHLFHAAQELGKALLIDGPFATITPTGNERAAVALSAVFARAGNRTGFTLAPELYSAPLSFDPTRSQIANNLRVVEALGHAAAAPHEPQVFFAESDLAAVRDLLSREYDPGRPLAVLVTQTSPTQRKGWRPERFAAAAQFLTDTYSAQIVLVGTRPERPAISDLRRMIHGSTWNLAGNTNLRQLAGLLSLCDIGLTLDTGTLHLGRAVGLPMVVIAPAWSPPIEWLPINNPRYTVLKNLDLPSAPPGYLIDEVSVDEVTSALADLMQRYPPSERPAHPAR